MPFTSTCRYLAAILLSLWLGSVRAADALTVVDPWIREAPPNAPALAAYLRIDNASSSARRLAGIESESFAAIVIHETVVSDGVARMEHRDGVEIEAGGSVEFAPGGLHLMLMEPEQELSEGDRVTLTLIFDRDDRILLEIPVRRASP
jgi:hypothetical protein